MHLFIYFTSTSHSITQNGMAITRPLPKGTRLCAHITCMAHDYWGMEDRHRHGHLFRTRSDISAFHVYMSTSVYTSRAHVYIGMLAQSLKEDEAQTDSMSASTRLTCYLQKQPVVLYHHCLAVI